jgi:hypothetical protein
MRSVPVLEDIDSLPRSEHGLTIDDRYRKLCIGERGPDMSRHVVGASTMWAVQLVVFGREATEMVVEIGDHVRVGVLLNCQGGGCVLDENSEQAGFQSRLPHPYASPRAPTWDPLSACRLAGGIACPTSRNVITARRRRPVACYFSRYTGLGNNARSVEC